MEDFLLLGQVPGTSITITFGTWLLITAWIILLALAYFALKNRKHLEFTINAFIVAFSIRRQLR